MADSQSEKQDRRPAELLLNLPSNNPFRNRNSAVSPTASQSPASPFDDPPPRPLSRNPFLDPAIANQNQANWSSNSNLSVSDNMSADKRPSLTAEDIFGSLTLEDSKPKPTSAAPPRPSGAKPPRPPGPPGPPGSGRHGPRQEGMRPSNPGGGRPPRPQEGAHRARRAPENGGRPDPSRSPQRPDRERRRNSESSVAEAGKTMSEEEKKKRYDPRRGGKPPKHLDIIDKLDATSIWGTGMFHHDGPFDAVNPRRNRQGSRRRPMDAFPEGSLNNTIGGSGPLNARPNHAQFLGQQDDEAFKEWSQGVKDKSGPVFDIARAHVLHGDESLGLGTSTFLEGTPAARSAIQNQQREEEERAAELPKTKGDGLKRGPSLRRPFAKRGFQASGDIPAMPHNRSPSGNGPVSASAMERKPFFDDYGSGNGEDDFTVANGSRASPASPRGGGGLERRSTTDGTGGEQGQQKPKGLLGRMKSITGKKEPRRPPGSEADAVPLPGTAV